MVTKTFTDLRTLRILVRTTSADSLTTWGDREGYWGFRFVPSKGQVTKSQLHTSTYITMMMLMQATYLRPWARKAQKAREREKFIDNQTDD